MRTIIVVPCYNESDRLNIHLFDEYIAEHFWVDFLFVDDGSTDQTIACLKELQSRHPTRIQILTLGSNQGKAEAVRRGFVEAFARNPALVGFWDADLATPLAEISIFRQALEDNPQLEIVMGSRVRLLGKRINRQMKRHYVSRVAATMISLILGISVYDTQCGAKMFRANETAKRIFEHPFKARWLFDVEILSRWLIENPTLTHTAIDERIHELPLAAWSDVQASRLRPVDFLLAPFELFQIFRSYSIPRRREP